MYFKPTKGKMSSDVLPSFDFHIMNVNVQLEGTILAPQSRHDYPSDMKWITFEDLENLRLQGGGQFNGRGQEFWACREDKKCDRAPTVSNYYSFSRPNNLTPRIY